MINIPDFFITELNKIFYKFVWNGTDKIKRKTIIANILETQKIIWGKRFYSNNYHPWKEFMMLGLICTGSNDIFNRKIPQQMLNVKKLKNVYF